MKVNNYRSAFNILLPDLNKNSIFFSNSWNQFYYYFFFPIVKTKEGTMTEKTTPLYFLLYHVLFCMYRQI